MITTATFNPRGSSLATGQAVDSVDWCHVSIRTVSFKIKATCGCDWSQSCAGAESVYSQRDIAIAAISSVGFALYVWKRCDTALTLASV
ncbi:hypothetical protein GWI33_018465 [Rhynchophorus ferrugineus]|uniref:Uncharacterized protein n=1 Tax=Rhynchophorus ferrugineus TaxID=354439 RepID=A0A834HUU9_RHYFE|nr:hypothetical protein GWI33_018465 [Rhynchophorus ferrugineus]